MPIEEIDLYWLKAEDLAKYLPSGGCGEESRKLAEKLIAKTIKAADCPEINDRLAKAIDGVLSVDLHLPESDPMQEKVKERLLEYGSPDAGSPIVLTGNSKLTHEVLGRIFDAAQVRAFVVPVDTNGLTMDNAAAGGEFTPMAVMKAINESGIAAKASSKRAIVSGLVANQKSGIERVTRWTLEVGPVSGFELPLYLVART